MTPGARISATIEIFQQLFTAWAEEQRLPADKALDNYFKSHRYMGSKDRAFVGEIFYWILRHKASIEWHFSCHSREGGNLSHNKMDPRVKPEDDISRILVLSALMLRGDYDAQSIGTVFDDSKYSPKFPTPHEQNYLVSLSGKALVQNDMPEHVRLNYPEWLGDSLHENFRESFEAGMAALAEQAPTDLRVNTLKTTREALLDDLTKEGFECTPTPTSPVGLRMHKRMPVFTSRYFKQGHFEMQDEGSQIVALLTDARPGHRVIDFCAGAGGKTLAIAAQMKNKGRILAFDTAENRLFQMKKRLLRSGIDNVQMHPLTSENDTLLKRHKKSADRVLVDAPCSGSGTWRRNPDLKWRTTEKGLAELVELQEAILQSAARLVKPGGRLIYATCSVLGQENDQQIAKFLKNRKDFTVVCAQKIWDNLGTDFDMTDTPSYLWVTPHEDGVDGFFAAVLERQPDAVAE